MDILLKYLRRLPEYNRPQVSGNVREDNITGPFLLGLRQWPKRYPILSYCPLTHGERRVNAWASVV